MPGAALAANSPSAHCGRGSWRCGGRQRCQNLAALHRQLLSSGATASLGVVCGNPLPLQQPAAHCGRSVSGGCRRSQCSACSGDTCFLSSALHLSNHRKPETQILGAAWAVQWGPGKKVSEKQKGAESVRMRWSGRGRVMVCCARLVGAVNVAGCGRHSPPLIIATARLLARLSQTSVVRCPASA